MRNNIKKSLKVSTGITLIALVITIIVLLILAGISISMLSGDNGILQRATDAKTETEKGEVYEQISIATASGEMEYYSNGTDRMTAYKNALLNGVEGIDRDNLTDNGSSLITGTVTTKSGKKYDFSVPVPVADIAVAEHKEKNQNELTIAELKSNASTYFGWDVINYKDTLPTEYQNIEWQLFYVGKIDDEDTTEQDHIYLISKDYVPYTLLPAKNNVLPLPKGNTDYKTGFSKYNSSENHPGVVSQYTGSASIETIGQKLNSQYYKYLNNNSKTSMYNNIKAVAYMLDSEIWNNFKGANADYAIGGPSVELLFKAYNKYKNLSGSSEYKTKVEYINGYTMSKNGGTSWGNDYGEMIENDTETLNSPYIVSNNTKASKYWLASPGMDPYDYPTDCIMFVTYTGSISRDHFGISTCGFRPLICLDSNIRLEKTIQDEKNVFKIVKVE